MQHDSRIKKSLLNARVNLICYVLSITMSFFSRKIFIDQLGADFLGLSSTLNSLLGFLNLAELGLGQAIAVVLYKPIYDKNNREINEVISVLGFLYRIIGLVILVAGVILSFFLPQIFPHTSFSPFVIYLGFYSFLFSSLIGYFVNYRQNLLWADQRGYEVTGYFQVIGLVKTTIQMALAWYVRSYILYFAIEIIFGIVFAAVLNWRIDKVYPWLKANIKNGYKLLSKYPKIKVYTGQLLVHRIGSFVQMQITPMLIYGFASLGLVAYYNNYTALTTQIASLMGTVLNTTSASVGSLVAENNKDKIYKVYKELLSIRYLLSGILCLCFFYLSSDFISVWLGSKYVLSDVIVLLICIQAFFNMVRGVNEEFINGFGLFSDIWAPLVEAAIFVCVSLAMGHYYGLTGVLFGPVVSLLLIVNIWKPYFLFSKGMKISVWHYWKLVFVYLILLGCSYLVAREICELIPVYGASSWLGWLLKAAEFGLSISVVSFVLFYLLGPGTKEFIQQLISVGLKRSNK